MMSAGFRRQQGMALLISLVVLVIVSVLGATAMRSAAFQSKVSVNAQATQVLFQAAESGLAAVESFAENQVVTGTLPQQAGHIFAAAYNGQAQRACFDGAGTVAVTADADRVVLNSEAIRLDYDECPQVGDNPAIVSTVISRPPCALDLAMQAQGYSLGIGGWGFRSIYVQSFAQVDGLGFTTSHVQLWSILSPSSGLTTCT